jgi:hypothetical protein
MNKLASPIRLFSRMAHLGPIWAIFWLAQSTSRHCTARATRRPEHGAVFADRTSLRIPRRAGANRLQQCRRIPLFRDLSVKETVVDAVKIASLKFPE